MKKKEIKQEETAVIAEKSREETDLERYEALYEDLKELNIRSIGDLENLIARTKLAL